MPVPKRKKSKSRRDMRRATHQIKATNYNECPRCGTTRLPHRVCVNCGFYNKVDVLHLETHVH